MKTAFVTGATSGIGLATVRRLVRDGWRCVATGRRKQRLDALVAELGADKVHSACFDVRDSAAMDAALASLPQGFGDID
ncbi:MAG: SDR family NAD(P)-dependent oxidoreductase, partial [Erythrobacter sp.]